MEQKKAVKKHTLKHKPHCCMLCTLSLIKSCGSDAVFKLFCNFCTRLRKESMKATWITDTKKSLKGCSICRDSFALQKRIPHECSRPGVYLHSCLLCGQQLESEKSLTIHIKVMHGRVEVIEQKVESAVLCSVDPMMCVKVEELPEELLGRISPEPTATNEDLSDELEEDKEYFFCQLCGEVVSELSSFTQHLQLHKAKTVVQRRSTKRRPLILRKTKE